jgi:hypothetical protein
MTSFAAGFTGRVMPARVHSCNGTNFLSIIFFRYHALCFLGTVGTGGVVDIDPQLLVPLSVPLRRPVRGPQFFEHFKGSSQRRDLHQLPKMHPHLSGGHQGP